MIIDKLCVTTYNTFTVVPIINFKAVSNTAATDFMRGHALFDKSARASSGNNIVNTITRSVDARFEWKSKAINKGSSGLSLPRQSSQS
ncbi:MAG: hypothetical protein KME29_02655 [Calothrix sp. FI2-JRJ7]|nr:hypothetical protein [Calothrix sp. FI2-JRJ7]